MTAETADCPVCHGTVAVYVPARGDGSLVVLRPHGPCRARCPGSARNPDPRDTTRSPRL